MPRTRLPRLSDWKKWLRTSRPLQETAHLGRRYIYILPTRQGLLYALMLICMLAGSINYTLSLGFVLTFLLAGLGVVAMLHTWRNLAHLELASGKLTSVFVGDRVCWELLITDPEGRSRYAIGLGLEKDQSSIAYADIGAGQRSLVVLPLQASRRGWLAPGRLTVSTEFPLGLFYAWAYVALDARCLIYPRPASIGLPLPVATTHAADGSTHGTEGDEDFSGLRAYQHGDSPKRVDWKASARARAAHQAVSGHGTKHAVAGLEPCQRRHRAAVVAIDTLAAGRKRHGAGLWPAPASAGNCHRQRRSA